jgi:hypothetical protein
VPGPSPKLHGVFHKGYFSKELKTFFQLNEAMTQLTKESGENWALQNMKGRYQIST